MTAVLDQVAAAKATIDNLSPEQVAAEVASGAVLDDLREPAETAEGIIGSAVLAPRGMLEFRADPTSP